MSEVRTDFTGDSSSIEEAAKRAQASINGVANEAKKVDAVVAKVGKTTTASFDAAGNAAGRLGGNAQKLGGALGSVSPAAMGVAGAIANVADVVEVASVAATGLGLTMSSLTVILPPVAAALAIVGAAYLVIAHNAKEAEDAQKKHREEAQRAGKTYGELGDLLRDVGLENDIALGRTTSSIEKMKEQREQLKRTYELGVAEDERAGRSSKALTERYERELKELNARIKAEENALHRKGEAVKEVAAIEVAAFRAITSEQQKANDARDARIKKSQELIDAVTEEGRSEREKIVQSALAQDASFSKLIRQAKEAGESAEELEEARIVARAHSSEKLKEYDEKEIAAAKAKNDAINAMTEQSERDRVAEAEAANANVVQSFAAVTDALMSLGQQQLQNRIDSLDTSTKEGKKAAKELWEQQQALAIAQALLNTAMAVSAAFATPPAPNFVAATAAAVVGGINMAAVAASPAPQFAAGGFPDATTMGSPAILHPNEAVLNQRARKALGDDTIRDLNSGRGGNSGVTQVTQIYKHKVFDYFISDNLLTGGPLGRSLHRGERVGQIRRGRA